MQWMHACGCMNVIDACMWMHEYDGCMNVMHECDVCMNVDAWM